MKIIGKTDSGFILDANDCPRFHLGDTIDVSDTWRSLRHVLALHEDFASVSKTLVAMQNLLDHVGKGLSKMLEAGE